MIAMIRSSRARATTGWHKVIVGLNDKPSGTNPATTPRKTHFVVVIGIDTKARVVHLNDSGIKHGRDEQVALAAFETHGPSATTLPSSPSDSAQQERRERNSVMHTYAQRGLKLPPMVAALPARGLVMFGGSALAHADPVSFFDNWTGHDRSMLLSQDGTGTLTLGDGALNTDQWAMTRTKNPSDSITIALASLKARSGPGSGCETVGISSPIPRPSRSSGR